MTFQELIDEGDPMKPGIFAGLNIPDQPEP